MVAFRQPTRPSLPVVVAAAVTIAVAVVASTSYRRRNADHDGSQPPVLQTLRDILASSADAQQIMGIGRVAAYAGGPLFYFATNHPKRDLVSGEVISKGVFDNEIATFAREQMIAARSKHRVEDLVAVDVGANIGGTVTLQVAAEGFNVVSFEMQPSVAARLELALKLNKWHGTRVHLFNNAVASEGDKACVAFDQLAANKGNVGGTPGHLVKPGSAGCTRGIRIDGAVGYSRRIPVMKIDVEGMEHEALKSSRELFNRDLVDQVVLEIRPSQSDVFTIMREYGFHHVVTIASDGSQTPMLEKDVAAFLNTTVPATLMKNVIFRKR
jgi:FkbM family methyltransferase